MPSPLTAHSSENLRGTIHVPGDKSISHRALMLSALCIGTAEISGLLEGEDVLSTAEALRHLGVEVTQLETGKWQVRGVGVGGLSEPSTALDMGNSGTSTRLMIGLLAAYPFTSIFIGDESLSKRPMGRVLRPLEEGLSLSYRAREGGKLPLTLTGSNHPRPLHYALPVASAQVKSALILAGLHCPGTTTVIEPTPTRDHTERMLRSMGAEITTEEKEDGRHITVQGYPQLTSQSITVPGDPSSAAFLTVAALITPGSTLTIKNICLNETRRGLYDTLIEMGGDIRFENPRETAGEEVADIVVSSSQLHGITVPASRAPSMIDEYPILAIAAACAEGTTHMEGLEELKVKESNRLQAIADGLEANGVNFEMGEDSLSVTGMAAIPGGGTVATHLDHRIAMAFVILGLVSQDPVTVDDSTMINTSFPGFTDLMRKIGAKLS